MPGRDVLTASAHLFPILPDALLISRDCDKVSVHQKHTCYARTDTRIPFIPGRAIRARGFRIVAALLPPIAAYVD